MEIKKGYEIVVVPKLLVNFEKKNRKCKGGKLHVDASVLYFLMV